MVIISGHRKRGRDSQSPDENHQYHMERLKPLHNFNLPYLKWGNQKLLRCMKVDSISTAATDRNQNQNQNHSSESSAGGGGFGTGTPRRDSEFNRRFGSSNYDYKFSSSAGDGEIEATRAKLMFDFQKEVGKMKDAILRERLVDPPPEPPPAIATTTASNSPADRPWNLRTRRAPSNGEVLKPNSSSSPLRNESKNPKLRPANAVPEANTSGEKRERAKFSVSLSRREVEEDYVAMAGRRLPRKPKKRPRIVQKQLDTLFPGLWLTEITADMYKVEDESETGKR